MINRSGGEELLLFLTRGYIMWLRQRHNHHQTEITRMIRVCLNSNLKAYS